MKESSELVILIRERAFVDVNVNMKDMKMKELGV